MQRLVVYLLESAIVQADFWFQKLKDTTPEVKQATDKESRGEHPFRGGRGRGRGGGYAARGFAAAGLTRHGNRGSAEGNGDSVKPSNAGDAT